MRLLRQGLASMVAVLLVGAVTPAGVLAYEGELHSDAAAQTERREAAQTRLQDAKLRACQNRKTAITAIMDRTVNRGEKQIALFTAVAERTKAFYTEKGLVLDNYGALVAAVDAKKAAAQGAVDEVKGASGTFSCEGDNPKGVAEGFKTKLKTAITALKEYRSAVKDLVVGVKSATKAEKVEDGGR